MRVPGSIDLIVVGLNALVPINALVVTWLQMDANLQ
jgi:hypothetical protein